MRILTIVLLAIHGLIHLLGCAKEWHLLALPELSGRTSFALPDWASKLVGGTWLVAFLLLTSAALSLLVQHGLWWLPALAGLVLSQLLVIYAWPDAKAGTVLNLVLLLPVLVASAD